MRWYLIYKWTCTNWNQCAIQVRLSVTHTQIYSLLSHIVSRSKHSRKHEIGALALTIHYKCRFNIYSVKLMAIEKRRGLAEIKIKRRRKNGSTRTKEPNYIDINRWVWVNIKLWRKKKVYTIWSLLVVMFVWWSARIQFQFLFLSHWSFSRWIVLFAWPSASNSTRHIDLNYSMKK